LQNRRSKTNKKVKAFYEELVLLEELQTKAVVRLIKAKMLIETVAKGESISKDKLTSDEIKLYKVRKLETIQKVFKEKNSSLIEEKEIDRYSKKQQPKVAKKATVIETLELWQQQNSVKEIATLRKLSSQTIYSHLAKLIESKTIALSDVLPETKIQELATAFKGYKEETLTKLKEQHGDRFSWDELKLFKASI